MRSLEETIEILEHMAAQIEKLHPEYTNTVYRSAVFYLRNENANKEEL